MKLQELFKIQKNMEDKISTLSGINENIVGEENIIHLRFLALQIKIGELANLTKCYKYNKTADDVPKNKLLFRYLEGMKYLLSIGNKYQLNIINQDAFDNVVKHDNLILLFSEIYDGLVQLKGYISSDSYVDALNKYIFIFAKYIHLAEALGIEYDEAYNYFIEINVS